MDANPETYALILSELPCGVLLIDAEGKLIFANPMAEKFLGTALVEIPRASRTLAPLLSTRDLQAISENEIPLVRALQGDTVRQEEFVVISAEYPLGVVLRVTARPLSEKEAGGKGGAFLTFEDITEQKSAAEALGRSNARFDILASTMTDVVWDWDLLSDQVWRNHGNHTLFGYPREVEGAFDFWKSNIHPEDRARVLDSLNAIMKTEESQWQQEYRYKRFSGDYAYVLDRGYVMRDRNGHPIRMIGTQMDITSRKLTENRLRHQAAELERSNKDLKQFAYVASHDLKEPLRMVTSYVQLLHRRYYNLLDDDGKDFIRFATEGACRMHALIDDLLAYSHVDRRNDTFEMVDCHEVMSTVIANLQESIRESSAEVAIGELPSLVVDPTQLGQLLQNLIGNALKYRKDEPPKISVSAQRQGQGWTFYVKDNGIGIEPEYNERIFNLFQRLHTKEEYAGTGIGLAICKKIMERHGGSIGVRSKFGEGSTFFFHFPDREVSMAPPAESALLEKRPLWQ